MWQRLRNKASVSGAYFSCSFQDLVYLLSFTPFSHLFNLHRQLLLLLGGAGANLEFSSKHLVLECFLSHKGFLSTCPILQKTKRCFLAGWGILERSTHSNSRSQYGTAYFIITCFNSVRVSTLKQAYPNSLPFTVPAASWIWVCHPLGGQNFKTSSCSWGVLLPLLTYHRSSSPLEER
jgi:hypothetical protein